MIKTLLSAQGAAPVKKLQKQAVLTNSYIIYYNKKLLYCKKYILFDTL